MLAIRSVLVGRQVEVLAKLVHLRQVVDDFLAKLEVRPGDQREECQSGAKVDGKSLKVLGEQDGDVVSFGRLTGLPETLAIDLIGFHTKEAELVEHLQVSSKRVVIERVENDVDQLIDDLFDVPESFLSKIKQPKVNTKLQPSTHA